MPFALPGEELKRYAQFQPDMDKRHAEAKRLLAEAGYAKGLTVELLLRRGPLYERGALSRQDDLKKIGVTQKIVLLDTATIRDRTLKGDFQAYTLPASVQYDDPDRSTMRGSSARTRPTRAGTATRSSTSSSRHRARRLIVGKRAEITRKMERILLQDIPDDRGYYWNSSMGYWNRVQQWPPVGGTTVYNFGKFEQVWCQGGKCM